MACKLKFAVIPWDDAGNANNRQGFPLGIKLDKDAAVILGMRLTKTLVIKGMDLMTRG
jgi:hypothetical protein